MKRWTSDEIEKLKQIYSHTTNTELLKLFPRFNLRQIRYKARSFKLEKLPEIKQQDMNSNVKKMVGEKMWTEKEELILQENYEIMGSSGLQELLPNRSRAAISSKAVKMNLSTTMEAKWKMIDMNYDKGDVFSINVQFERLDR